MTGSVTVKRRDLSAALHYGNLGESVSCRCCSCRLVLAGFAAWAWGADLDQGDYPGPAAADSPGLVQDDCPDSAVADCLGLVKGDCLAPAMADCHCRDCRYRGAAVAVCFRYLAAVVVADDGWGAAVGG